MAGERGKAATARSAAGCAACGCRDAAPATPGRGALSEIPAVLLRGLPSQLRPGGGERVLVQGRLARIRPPAPATCRG